LWENPKEEDFDYIRVLRNQDRFYSNPEIGHLVYEGNGRYFTDSNVKEGVKYFYSLFSRDRAGNYSSGSLISVIFNPNGNDYWGTEFSKDEYPEELEYLYKVTQGPLSYDFKIDSIIKLSGDSLINIKTNYTRKTKNDDTWLVVKNEEGATISQYFFSKAKDKDGFINIDIPSFKKKGLYHIAIFRYHNGITTLVNRGIFEISKDDIKNENHNLGYLLGASISIILIILLLIRLFLIIQRKKNNKDNNI